MNYPFAAAVALVCFAGAVPSVALAQAMKIPGESAAQSNVVKPEALNATQDRIDDLKLPLGFRIEKFAEGLRSPRVIAVADDGTVYVSSRDEGTITMLRAAVPREVTRRIVLKKKDVHGIAIRGRRIFYATIREVFSAPINTDGSLGRERLVSRDLPDAGQHANRTLGFGPDGMLYLSIGSTCNSCDERNPENATMVRIRPDGKGRREIFASGLRNTIGFAWQPATGDFYGLDNGIDAAGDDQQEEELNHLRRGAKYGWPYIHGAGHKDALLEPRHGTLDDWDKASVRPSLTYTAHASPMQLVFVQGEGFPAEYRGDALATMKGSWNRKTPSGYEIVRIRFQSGKPTSIEPFLTGFLVQVDKGGWGRFARPFGLAWAKDGSLLMGEEQNGIIYRITAAN